MTKKKTIDEVICDFIRVHGNKYDYSNVNYVNTQTKVKIICKIHGEFEQQPNNHLMGKGCRKCSNVEASMRNSSNTNEFIKSAKEKHGNTYNYENVDYINNVLQVKIICKIHGEFEQTPADHLSGCGCQICGKNKQIKLQTKTTEKFLIDANNKHNNKYDYSLVEYINTKTKIKIICPIEDHGIFEQIPSSHLSGAGCKKCATIQQHTLLKSNTNDFIKKAKLIHGNEYNYSLVNYINNTINVTIICNIHGKFEQKPAEHLSGCGCPKCVGKNKTTQDFIKDAINIHKNENNKQLYDYSNVNYINAKQKIKIICKEHGEFIMSPNNHLNSQGCPKCSISKQYSKAQIKWLNFIQSKDNITIQHAENDCEFKIPNTKFKADGYCKETNTIYEYHGDYWHGNPYRFNSDEINKTTKCTFGELYQNTLNKEQQIRDLGFNLITIWESDWIKLNKCVKLLQRKFRISKMH